MPVTFSSYRLGPGQRVSNKTVPPPWDWLLRRENELGPRRSKSRIIFAVLVPPLYVAVQAPALNVTQQNKRNVLYAELFKDIVKYNPLCSVSFHKSVGKRKKPNFQTYPRFVIKIPKSPTAETIGKQEAQWHCDFISFTLLTILQ